MNDKSTMFNLVTENDILMYDLLRNKLKTAVKEIYDLTLGKEFEDIGLGETVRFDDFWVNTKDGDIVIEYSEEVEGGERDRYQFEFPFSWFSTPKDGLKPLFDELRKNPDWPF